MSLKRIGFGIRTVYKHRKPKMLQIAKQKLSFLVASMSLFAFVVGNMVGQHGWYAFWKTVMGKEDDSMIVFVGTVPPIARIPDYTLWSQYAGSKDLHTYTQVPQSVLREIPSYSQTALTNGTAPDLAKQAYSTLWAGGYTSPQGSHGGVDIDAPKGTPVVSIANGVVERMEMTGVGFGHYVMVRHPNVPDPENPGKFTTLYSTYAHLDAVLVQVGEVLHKGQQLGTVGNTGLVFGATGYHLYFQIDKEDAPYHPYWPFTSAEASAAGMSFYQAVNSTRFQGRVIEHTLNPMAFVQQNVNYTAPTVVASAAETGVVSQTPRVTGLTPKQLRDVRLQNRLAKAGLTAPVQTVAVVTPPVSSSSSSSSSVSSSEPAVIEEVTQVKTAQVSEETIPTYGTNTDVDRLRIEHSGKLSHVWQKVKIYAVDRNGDTVRAPSFSGRLYLVPEFGEATIRPSELSPLDFVNGVATVNVLARGSKTLFISTRGAFTTISAPMVFDR